MLAAELTVVGCALTLDANPPFLRDGLVYHSQHRDAVAQKCNQGAKDGLTCGAITSIHKALQAMTVACRYHGGR